MRTARIPLLLCLAAAGCRPQDDVCGPDTIPPERAGDVPYLIAQLRSPNAYRRGIAADLLGNLRDPRAIEPLIRLLPDGTALDGSDNWVGAHAAGALSRLTGRPFDVDQDAWQAWWKDHRREYFP